MAKSITKNKLAEFDIEKIRRFAETELAKLTTDPLPFCYQIGADKLIVGKYKVIKVDERCWRVVEGNEQKFDFFNRKDAIYYCIALHKKDYSLAKDIKDNDSLLGKLEFEAILYRKRFKKAQTENNEWCIDLYSNRYKETMTQIEKTKRQLKKSINLAKYIKV